ncbi:MAG: xylose isomerase [Candidatus Binatia bacterium]|nr:xylose isomerase [Candidatus Binatia bacterium]
MSAPLFDQVEKVTFEGPQSDNPFAYRHYDPDAQVLGKRMEEHVRFAVCYWHNFVFQGQDMFGGDTFDRPWTGDGGMPAAHRKAEVAFELFEKLGAPYFTFHDRDIAPEGATLSETNGFVDEIVAVFEEEMARTGVKLLWGTANLFSNPRFAAGAATNPDPEVFAYGAAQVKKAMDVTHALGGENYVLWGGREGYDTLLNTDLRQETEQFGRFMHLAVEHKHKIGFKGTLLIEPKPMEPTKHQYDSDSAAVHAFLRRFGLEREIALNIEVNHATLAGKSFEHELAYAVANDLLGSVDMNRGDPQNGWDTDQFPNSAEDMTVAFTEILRGGGLKTGGCNFDAKLRRQSIDPHDLLHAHIGGVDTLARGLLQAEKLIEEGRVDAFREERYAGWKEQLGRDILAGRKSLDDLSALVLDTNLEPKAVSGRQEMLENLVNRVR